MLMWQDVVIAVGAIGFSLALIFSIRSQNKPSKTTSLITGGILVAYAICFATLGLMYSGITTTITALLWFILFVQVLKRRPVQ